MKATPINIEVSDAVTMSAEAGEVNAQVSSFIVTNKGQNGTIEVKKLQVTPQNGYQIVSDTSDFATMDVNTKAFSLKYGSHDFVQPYTNVDEIQPTKTKTYDLTGKIALVSENVIGQNAGSMVATVGWKEAVDYSWAGASDEMIVKMVQAADKGEIDLNDYWKVGDTRRVTLSAMDSSHGLSDTHVKQEIELVLMHRGRYKDVNGKEVNFVVGQKNCLKEKGEIYPQGMVEEDKPLPMEYSWENSNRREWCNNTYYNSYPESLKPIFKQFINYTAKDSNQESQVIELADYFTLPAEKEIFGEGCGRSGNGFSIDAEAQSPLLFQFDYYKNPNNYIKYLDENNVAWWWERSPGYFYNYNHCIVRLDGVAYYYNWLYGMGLAPFGCI